MCKARANHNTILTPFLSVKKDEVKETLQMQTKQENTQDQLEILQRDYDGLLDRHTRLRQHMIDTVKDVEEIERLASIRVQIFGLAMFSIGIGLSAFVYAVFLA